ncbi:MAG: type II toxin-antitoxin system RelB/DinJ family antitoxin [Eubacterium sp.]|nr:type II toxin-antitoxin system RelB/DinJ family antitoxin [Candidatus Colimonas fimequi]
MSSTTVTFRTDSELKKEAGELFESMGLNLSAALNMFMKQAVKDQRFPFAVETEFVPDVSGIGDFRHTYPEGFFDLFGSGKDLDIDVEMIDEGFVEKREE